MKKVFYTFISLLIVSASVYSAPSNKDSFDYSKVHAFEHKNEFHHYVENYSTIPNKSNEKKSDDYLACTALENYKRDGNFVYVVNKDHICIIDYISFEEPYSNESPREVIEIPSHIEGLPVTYIHNLFLSWAPIHPVPYIDLIYIPETITSLPDGFANHTTDGPDYIPHIEISPENPVYEVELSEKPADYEYYQTPMSYFCIYDKTRSKLVSVIPAMEFNYRIPMELSVLVKDGTKILGKYCFTTDAVDELVVTDSLKVVQENLFLKYNYRDDTYNLIQLRNAGKVHFFEEYSEQLKTYEARNNKESEQSEESVPSDVSNFYNHGFTYLKNPKKNPYPNSFTYKNFAISNDFAVENGYIYCKQHKEIIALIEQPKDNILTISDNITRFESYYIHELQYIEKDGDNLGFRWKDSEIKELNIPASVSQIYWNRNLNFAKINIASSNPYFKIKNNCLIDLRTDKILQVFPASEDNNLFIIPDGTKTITENLINVCSTGWGKPSVILCPSSIEDYSISSEIVYGSTKLFGAPESFITKAMNGIILINYGSIKEDRNKGLYNIYKTTDNLKLRSSPNLSGNVITVLNKDSIVYPMPNSEKENWETIDGIRGKWIKVVTYNEACDTSGKKIAAGTTGWLFSGYLKNIRKF